MSAERETARPASDSDITLLAMFDGILSDGEREKLRAERELAKARLDVRIKSMREARDILERAKDKLDAAIVAKALAIATYEEAMLELADDETDDWETAAKKAYKFERIEQEYLEADNVIADARAKWKTALIRVNWELREAERLGYSGNEK